MVDMESETATTELENGPGPPEPVVCCRCRLDITADQHVFDCDSCSHSTCLGCRFKEDIPCCLCKPQISSETENTAPSLKEMYSLHFKRRKFNKDHIVDVELSTDEGNVQKQMCTICKRVFKKSNAYYHYMCATGEKPFECPDCGQKFVKKGHYESHLNTHYGVRPFKCPESKCKASFTQKDKLIRHQKSHKREVKVMCPLCDKQYTTQDILNHHLLKVHSTNKQFRCDQCPRTYKYAKSLRIHRFKHQAKRDYMCDVCGKKYALSAQLKLHKRSHVLYHRRPFKCRCGRQFMSRRDKARHELIHNSCHDYECSLCNTTFGRKDNLERHMKNFHQDGPLVMTRNGNSIPVASIAPFNSKPTVKNVKNKQNSILTKGTQRKEKTNSQKQNKGTAEVKVNKVKKGICSKEISPKQAKPKASNVRKSKVKNPANVKINTEKVTSEPTVNEGEKESNTNQSVIMSAQQNRPSVIKCIPHLLPYRILPPDKRFLKLSGELNRGNNSESQTSFKGNNPETRASFKGNNPETRASFKGNNPETRTSFKGNNPETRLSFKGNNPETRTSFKGNNPETRTSFKGNNPEIRTSFKGNNPETQTSFSTSCSFTQTSFQYGKKKLVSDNSEKAINVPQRTVNPQTVPQSVRHKTQKDDALNRCYRIIHHTSTVNTSRVREVSKFSKIKGNFETRQFGECTSFTSKRQQTFSSASVSLLGYASNKFRTANRNPSNVIYSQNTTDSNIGGPSLPVNGSDRVLEINHEDNFMSSSASTAEATYSSSSYTPYFDNEYFRDSINSYDSNAENLLPNDLDIGFQYINEQLGSTEVTFSSESRIIRYVAQETRIVRESI
ncbi:PR domain zinc finger protein 15-like [Macrosteles quadrilineatus]|uniref:PR domain zinc finger protein 15-like n=1 Tax=Macrosteles quadrilineatus TaxID=74068 RepID=UPI0023E28215|nr:PR domain zinc finger protein 15-like [Macrosteles quadrilineatus]